jgi:ribosomal protein L17
MIKQAITSTIDRLITSATDASLLLHRMALHTVRGERFAKRKVLSWHIVSSLYDAPFGYGVQAVVYPSCCLPKL